MTERILTGTFALRTAYGMARELSRGTPAARRLETAFRAVQRVEATKSRVELRVSNREVLEFIKAIEATGAISRSK